MLKFAGSIILLIISLSCSADWNVRGMSNTITSINASVNSDASISIALSGSRYPSNSFKCNVSSGEYIYNTWRYLVWFLEDINIDGKNISFTAPDKLYDSVGGNFDVEKWQWVNNGKSLILVARNTSGGISDKRMCWEGESYSFNTNLVGNAVGITLPAGEHYVSFGLRVMRIQASEDANFVYNLAIANYFRSPVTLIKAPVNIASYCISKSGDLLTLNYGAFSAGSANGRVSSAKFDYECNLDTALPKVILQGSEVSLCDGLTAKLTAHTERANNYNFRTIFTSTLYGTASSFCVGKFSKVVVATLTPP
ncbi:TPA: hypothetical protein JLM52_005020 [Escherichia coli]|nr:hypothetical protein [Escherichia coli]